MSALPDHAPFLSGHSGQITGRRLTTRATLADLALNARAALARTGRSLDALAATQEPRRVLILSLYRAGARLPGALPSLGSRRHEVHLALGAIGEDPDPRLAADTAATGLAGGKFENLNRVLETAGGEDPDWLLVVDDDVDLPPRFLDRFVAVCERLSLDLAQPAQTQRSHAAWRVTRRRPGLARLTRFVEIGPVTAFSRRAAAELLPFPELRFGWGLDAHWAAVARERGWRLGVVDALPVRHEWQPVATTYTHAEATEEAQRFLADREYLHRDEIGETLETVRRLRP